MADSAEFYSNSPCKQCDESCMPVNSYLIYLYIGTAQQGY